MEHKYVYAICEKDFVKKEIERRNAYHKKVLADEIMEQIWNEWIPNTLVFEHKFEYLDYPPRNSTLTEIVSEFAEKGWTVNIERLDQSSECRFKFSIS
jgi:hypothetical protein